MVWEDGKHSWELMLRQRRRPRIGRHHIMKLMSFADASLNATIFSLLFVHNSECVSTRFLRQKIWNCCRWWDSASLSQHCTAVGDFILALPDFSSACIAFFCNIATVSLLFYFTLRKKRWCMHIFYHILFCLVARCTF